jgi:hypothetical protein
MIKALTKKQTLALSKALAGTTANIYLTAQRLFGATVDDRAFDSLRHHANLFRCEECGEWKDLSELANDALSALCEQCSEEEAE